MKKRSTTKLLVGFLIGNFLFLQLIVIVLTFINMYLTATAGVPIDYSPLSIILTSVIGEIATLLCYCVKSGFENRKNGITYDVAMKELELNNKEGGEL